MKTYPCMSSKYSQNLETSPLNSSISILFRTECQKGCSSGFWNLLVVLVCTPFYPALCSPETLLSLLRWEGIGRCYQDIVQTVQNLPCLLKRPKICLLGGRWEFNAIPAPLQSVWCPVRYYISEQTLNIWLVNKLWCLKTVRLKIKT